MVKTLKFDTGECTFCGREFDDSVTKTRHHVVPKFMKPKIYVVIPLCKECHERMNLQYVHQTPYSLSEDFVSFKEEYLHLQKLFKNQKIDRSTFGAKLWTNLVNFLENLQAKMKNDNKENEK